MDFSLTNTLCLKLECRSGGCFVEPPPPPSLLKTNKQKVVFKKFKELVPCPIIYTILTIKYVQTKSEFSTYVFNINLRTRRRKDKYKFKKMPPKPLVS